MKEEGLRYNQGKSRYDLIHPLAEKGMVDVLTYGANKYEEKNWEKGMAWSKIIASLRRHLAAIEKGEDYDAESGLLHADHVQCNAHFLSAYYRIYPQGDDRRKYTPKIGLDIDEVICNWTGAWCEKFGYPIPEHWNFSYSNKEHFESFGEDLEEFYLNIPAKIRPSDLPFEPHCYITSRSVPVELTKQWIQKHGFPTVPVYCVGHNQSKVEVAKESGIDIFVDDSYSNFTELNQAGICTFLMDAPHNRKYNVGYRRITNLNQIIL